MDPKYFLYVEDVDFCYNVSSHGYIITCNKDSVIYHKEGQSSIIKPTVASFAKKIDVSLTRKAKPMDDAVFHFFFHQTHLPACNDAIIADKLSILTNMT